MGIDFDVLLSNLLDKKQGFTPELMELLSRQALKASGVGRPLVQGLEALESGQPMPELFSPAAGRPEAQSSIAGREASEAEDEINRLKEEAETKRMQEEAMQRSLDPLTVAGGGGPGSGKQYPADKLFAIREQARAMGGGGGLSAGGGTISQMTDDPAARARIADMDEWTARQPERNLEFAMTPEQAKMNPAYAATAADKLTQLQNQNQVQRQTDIAERKTANQEALIASLTKGGGKVPFETAMKLDAAGMPVPTFAIGRSPDQAKREFAEIKRGTLQDLQNAEISGLSQGEIAFLSYVLSAQMDIEGRIKAGEDPVKLLIELEKIIDFHADSSGARVAAQQRAASMKAAQEVK